MQQFSIPSARRQADEFRRPGTPITGGAKCFARAASSARPRRRRARHLPCACRPVGDGGAQGAGASGGAGRGRSGDARRGKPECEMEDLFMDFKGIQVTLAVMARAVITGRIDCKTAGQLVVQLQTISKLLWTLHKNKTVPQINTDHSDWKELPKAMEANAGKLGANEPEKARIVLIISSRFSAEKAEPQARKYRGPDEIIGRVDEDTGAQIRLEERGYRDRGQAHGPPKLRAA